MMQSCLYQGSVSHKRFHPKEHSLSYGVFNLLIDLDVLDDLSDRLRFFSVNRFNLISFNEGDYGNPATNKSVGLKQRLLDLLSENGVAVDHSNKIYALTYPRILGFTFNPLTVFYCLGAGDTQVAVIYEVRNTFGERHNYIFAIPEGKGFCDFHITDKQFHVSPFFEIKGQYQFKLSEPADDISVSIDYRDEGVRKMFACFKGRKLPLSDSQILKLSAKIPLMTAKVVTGILYEAMKLWLKGVTVFTRPDEHAYQSSQAYMSDPKNEQLAKGKSHEKS